MARKDPQFNVRMPQELKEMIEASARDNQRSINAEIIHHLRNAMLAAGYMASEQAEPREIIPPGEPIFVRDIKLTDQKIDDDDPRYIDKKWSKEFLEILDYVRREMKDRE
ncbi:Arc family DNA-binding protein [Aeromonas salmonicida]|uniref:Arc family DNA-binding protein n=1 Tax=Aeromonas salmonicida TaxID=645 RepID=UPI0022408008|nr:Arc family DNA-binding protein [Aeromonas salmonicida]MDF8330597.1 Arc family DNA-binding protein [Aeromonas salmonicida]